MRSLRRAFTTCLVAGVLVLAGAQLALAVGPDYTYTVAPDNSATITRYNGTETSVTIPSSIDGHAVVTIGHAAFYDRPNITNITIPVGVTSIGDEAFGICMGLKSISIPVGVTSIGVEAFGDCVALTSLTLPEGLVSIGADAFLCHLPESDHSFNGDHYRRCRVRVLLQPGKHHHPSGCHCDT